MQDVHDIIDVDAFIESQTKINTTTTTTTKSQPAGVVLSSPPECSNYEEPPRRDIDARLHYENIQLTMETKDRKVTILDGVWGESPQGQVSAIMGPSGSGKTSLLNVLSGRMSNATANIKVQADTVTWNGRPLDVTDLATRQTIAFVAQDDSLPVTSTPRESILFSARLRLDKDLTAAELEEITETMLRQLHLQSCADTFVGGALLKGISGGERKRTSVGVELVCKPKLVFLDEPTSGLDSFNAHELVQVLKQVAAGGSAVVLTIHQPSSDVWELFDRLTLLKQGRVMYEGRRADAPAKFANCGYPLPPNYNPADWVMNVAQTVKTELLESAGFFPVNDFSSHGKVKALNEGDTKLDQHSNHRAGFFLQTKELFKRELVHFKRNSHPLRTRIGMTVAISLLCGVLFFQAAQENLSSFVHLQTAFGALLLATLANMFSTVLPALVAFPEERPVFLREYSTGCYDVPAYLASRLFMEVVVTAVQVTVSSLITYFMVGLTQSYGGFWLINYALGITATAMGAMIGASVSDPSVAMEMLPPVFMPQILFSGFFIPQENMPEWLAWMTYIFPFTYAIRLVLVHEFEECEGRAQLTCDILLANVNANRDEEWWYWLVLLLQFVVCRVLALLILQRKAKKFY